MKRLYAINSNVANWNSGYIGNVGFILTEDLEMDMRRFALNAINKEDYSVDNVDSGIFSIEKDFLQYILFSSGLASFYTGNEVACFFIESANSLCHGALFTAVEVQPICFEEMETSEVSCTFTIPGGDA